MKKIMFILIGTMLLPFATFAKKPKSNVNTYKDCYIYAQSGRNTDKKGSALSLTTGETFSLQNANDKADTKEIDVMLFFGKVNGGKTKVFHLFAPNDPSVTIDWTNDGGTSPFCKFEGKGDDKDAPYALKNWKVRNATKLVKVTNVNFENATSESIDSLQISDSYIASDIKIGDFIAFKLAETAAEPGKKGLIKVTAIEDDEEKPNLAGSGQYQRLIVEVKIQK